MPIYPAFAGVSCEGRFLFNRKVILLNKKRSAEDRNSKEGLFTKLVTLAEATRRRRRIPRARFFLN